MDEQTDDRTAVARASTEPGSGTGAEPGSETETVPAGMAAEFSSLSTPYCWVITEDLVAGYDGMAPSAVGRYGPPQAEFRDVHEALSAGRWFRLSAGGQPRAVGRIYDPSGENEHAPLADFGAGEVGADAIEYRVCGQWEAV
jgi:hypothetical protein